MNKKDFENSLRVTTKALLISGIRISKTIFPKWLEIIIDYWMYYINVAWLYTDLYGEIYWVTNGISIGTSFPELSLVVPCVAISFLGTVKITFLYSNVDVVTKIVNKLRNMHPKTDHDNNSDDINDQIDDVITKDEFYGSIDTKSVVITDVKLDVDREVVKESADFLNNVANFLLFTGLVVIICFPSMPLVAMAYEFYTTGETDYKYPYLVEYGFDINSLWIWPVVYVHHVYSTVIVGANVIGCDSLFYALCIYIQMHFRLLGHQIQNIVSRKETSSLMIIQAVRTHQDLINLVDQVEFLYSKSMLFNIVTSSVMICLSGFIATILDDYTVVITFVSFLGMSLSQIFWLCYFGDMIMRSSTEITTAIYHSLWYEADKRTKKILLMILMRAQKPCKLTAYNFFNLNLNLFTAILSRSWSYFALLKTIYNDAGYQV